MAQRKPTKKQEKFVEEMANPNTKSQAEAARKAGYSPKRAKQTASENVTKSYLLERIEQRKKEAEQFAKITRSAVLGATAQIAFASIDDALDENGNFDIDKARASGAVHRIKKLRTKTLHKPLGEKEVIVEVEFYANDAALAKLGNYLGMEKQADVNPDALERNKENAEQLIKTWMERDGLSREAAIEALVKVKPEASEWIN